MSAPRILHYPGSKWSLAEWIIDHMPPHTTYLEPYFGSGAVFFTKQPSQLETINDLDGEVVNLFRVIRDRPDELSRAIQFTPYARDEYLISHHGAGETVERARRFLTRCWQSIRVKTGSISGWKCRNTPDDAYRVQQWNNLPERILIAADRLKEAQIENRPALELIERSCRADVLIYADPPYVGSTRGMNGGKMYEHEMTDDDHLELIKALDAHPGPVLLSGYASEIYDRRLGHWHRQTLMGKPVNGLARTEVLWVNPIAAGQVGQQIMKF